MTSPMGEYWDRLDGVKIRAVILDLRNDEWQRKQIRTTDQYVLTEIRPDLPKIRKSRHRKKKL